MANIFKPPKLYRSPGGWLFHTTPDCPLLNGRTVLECTEQEIHERHLYPCVCTKNSRRKDYDVQSKNTP